MGRAGGDDGMSRVPRAPRLRRSGRRFGGDDASLSVRAARVSWGNPRERCAVTNDPRRAGLPPAAEARMAEIQRSGTWGSALSADEFTAIRSTGFEPVGQVLGAAVYNLGYTGGYGCAGAWPATTAARPRSGRTARDRDVQPRRHVSFAPLVQALYDARHTAINRMIAECAELGGHGVVGVNLTIGPFPAGGLEFKAIGTAVRAPGAPPPKRPSPPTCPARTSPS